MSDAINNRTRLRNRLVDFLVLALTFFLSSLLLSIEVETGLIIQTIAYSAILLLFVCVSKKFILSYQKSVSEISRQILGNGTGILIGTCVFVLLVKLFSISGDLLVAVIVSSVMAFFILGTLSPLIHKKTPSH